MLNCDLHHNVFFHGLTIENDNYEILWISIFQIFIKMNLKKEGKHNKKKWD